MNKLIFTQKQKAYLLLQYKKNSLKVFVRCVCGHKQIISLLPSVPPVWGQLWLVGGAGCRGLVVAAVHLLLHGAVLLQLLAGVVGDLQEAAGLHHHVGLAGVRQDGVLRNHLHVLVTFRFQSVQFPVR